MFSVYLFVEIVNVLLWLFLRLNLVFVMFDPFGILISFICYWWLLRCRWLEKLGLVWFLTLDLVVGCMLSILKLCRFNAIENNGNKPFSNIDLHIRSFIVHTNNLNVLGLNSSGWRYWNVIELVYMIFFYPISPHMGLGTRKV